MPPLLFTCGCFRPPSPVPRPPFPVPCFLFPVPFSLFPNLLFFTKFNRKSHNIVIQYTIEL